MGIQILIDNNILINDQNADNDSQIFLTPIRVEVICSIDGFSILFSWMLMLYLYLNLNKIFCTFRLSLTLSLPNCSQTLHYLSLDLVVFPSNSSIWLFSRQRLNFNLPFIETIFWWTRITLEFFFASFRAVKNKDYMFYKRLSLSL